MQVIRSGRGRGFGIIVLAVAAGAAAGPPVIAVADNVKGVIIENSIDDPVLSKPVGTTPVTGTVGIADGAKVAVDSSDGGPIPVQLKGDDGAPVSEYWSLATHATIPADELTAFVPARDWYIVPAGKVLIVEGMSGQVTHGVGIVAVDRRNCPEPSPSGYLVGIITPNRNGGIDSWSGDGTFNFREGCVLKPWAGHLRGEREDDAYFQLYGRLVDAR